MTTGRTELRGRLVLDDRVVPGRIVIEDNRIAGVDVDDDLMGGDGTVPALFYFRDLDGNTLMIVEAQRR